MERRLGVIAIVLERREHVPELNAILSAFGSLILGRMGLPLREKGIHLISLIIDGNTDQIGALTGKLGKIPGIQVKSMLTKYVETCHE
ncbi:MAG TPA: iron-only hydrogenase system regulator [Synergistaceae bacterium]|nr:iron-only hydrogenase system regulator [Synergistaceae bacterium]HPJ25575.1 iron-only hydrogenase system regulator [Synergistaceae bacterium]HPQ36500.1 iron-only hydrogenase system regulator [Synergistaceae bacterium]